MFEMFHNYKIIQRAEDAINEFINDENCKVWITDEKGNCFIPEGKISVNYCEILEVEKEE